MDAPHPAPTPPDSLREEAIATLRDAGLAPLEAIDLYESAVKGGGEGALIALLAAYEPTPATRLRPH